MPHGHREQALQGACSLQGQGLPLWTPGCHSGARCSWERCPLRCPPQQGPEVCRIMSLGGNGVLHKKAESEHKSSISQWLCDLQ